MNESVESEQGIDESQLPGRRGVISMVSLILMQIQNAFNDNLARFMLLFLGGWLATTEGLMDIKHLLVLLLLFPFIAFSPFAGWLADRFRKNRIIQYSAWLQVVALGAMAYALWSEQIWLSCFAFFLLATQSALLSPAKMGVVKELVGSKRLGLASGVMEMTVILAILGGQILAGLWFGARLKESSDGWNAALAPVLILLGASCFALFNAYTIQRTPKQKAPPLTWGTVFSHKREMALLWQEPGMKLVALGVAFFWGFAGFINLVSINIGAMITGGEGDMGPKTSMMMIAASGGIALGSGLTGWLSRKRIELGLVPIGGMITVIALVALTMQVPDTSNFYFYLALSGFGGSMIMVPLTAYLQEISPADKRGSIMASSNILNNTAGVAAVLLQLTLEKVGLNYQWQFAVMALITALVTTIVIRHLLSDMVRFSIMRVLQVFYRIDVVGKENVPGEEEGGALLLPNHVGYMDAILLSAASPRPVRFLIADHVAKKWWASPAVWMFNAVPISPKRAKQALMIAADTIKGGDAVGIYPEGQLTRTGMMNEMKPGYTLIAKKAGQSVVPVYIDGLWKSIFSYSDGIFVKKWPQRLKVPLRVTFGPSLDPSSATPQRVAEELSELGRESWMRRDLEKWMKRLDRDRSHPLFDRWQELNDDEKEEVVINALQLAEVYPAQKGKRLLVCCDSRREDLTFGFALEKTSRLAIDLCQEADLSKQALNDYDGIVSGVKGYSFVRGEKTEVPFFLLVESLEVPPEWIEPIFPCFCKEGIVMSLSMPHPPVMAQTQFQSGYKAGSLGKILPGCSIRIRESDVLVTSPRQDAKMQTLGGDLDAEGFFFPR